MDDNALQMLAAVRRAPPASLLCPDYLFPPLAEAFPQARVLPYCAAATLDTEQAETTVIHKGALAAFGRARLRALLTESAPVFANAVFVVYRRRDLLAPGEAALDEAQQAHCGAVPAFLRSPLPRGTPRRAAIVSAHGAGNVGDDAVSLAAALMARAAGCTEITYTGPAGRLEGLEDLALVLIGGGGLFYDSDYQGRPDYENVGNYLAPLAFAREIGLPSAVLGIGVQGIRTELGAAAYRHGLRRTDLVTVRDAGDQEALARLTGHAHVHLTADLAFALPSLLGARPAPPPRPLGAKPLAILALAGSMGGFDGAAAGFAAFLQRLAMQLGRTHEVVLAQHSADDAKLYQQVAVATGAGLKVLSNLGPERSLDVYAQAEIVITSRYHGLIFGALGGARLAPIGDHGGKIGRLVAQRLPSLMPHTTFVHDRLDDPPEAVIDRAGKVDQAELQACIDGALENLALLRRFF